MSSGAGRLKRRDFLLCAGGASLLLASSGLDSILQQELNDPVAIASVIPRLQRIPSAIESWTSSDITMDEREIRHGGISGALRRVYRNTENGKTATLTVLCGAAGPISVHPPTACFEGVGYSLASGPSLTEVQDTKGQIATFNRASFRPQDSVGGEVVRVFWGWGTDGNWDAPSNPRVAFHGERFLYKLYVVDRTYETADDLAQCEAFLRDALPAIRAGLAGTPEEAPRA